ncbi:alpha/beta fold hydrolase [Sphingomonas sp. SUN039]|uniref:alpha/beta fold hydrolase n=1 Tax=Sphingomonas sp. SUN039 TaxID=2937787 RepID=UPI002164E574|nr:alpha/beta hydrolase [Sphingomonas sp. SUN039]UVO55296.1 alpha/beta hydrolase [Sphingomonas sp. SUN039]
MRTTHRWQTGTVPVTGGHLAWHRIGGNGPALVLSHGLTDNGLCWTRFAEALENEFDIVMLDARGHGASSRMPQCDTPNPGQDIAEAIDALGLVAPLVMGHSVGARAAAAFAAANPGRAARIVLEDPPLLPPASSSEMRQRRARFRQQVAELQSMSAQEIAAYGHEQSPDWDIDEFPAWVEGKQQVDPQALPEFATPWQQDFAAITAPTLLICGEPDRGGMVTPALASEAEALNANIRTVRIERAGHNIRRENFADYVTAVRAFLRDGGV